MAAMERGLNATSSVVLDRQEPEIASQRQLIWRKFKRHRVAVFCLYVIVVLYTIAVFAEFFAPYGAFQRHPGYLFAPPTQIHFFDEKGAFQLPFVYKLTNKLNMQTFQREYVEDTSEKYPLRFFVRRNRYNLLGFIPTQLHLVGMSDPGVYFPFGTDALGRDLFSRMLFGARISLFVGLVGLALAFVLGLFFGGISGFYGGGVRHANSAADRVFTIFTHITFMDGSCRLGASLLVAYTSLFRNIHRFGDDWLDGS